mgnify:CR=1 FL=1
MSTGKSPSGPPQPPAKGRPAPPKKGPPSPPKSNVNNKDGSPNSVYNKRTHDDISSIIAKAESLEVIGEFSQAAIFYRSAGKVEDENRCLQLALSKSESNRVTNIHNGNKIIRDSVIMDDD